MTEGIHYSKQIEAAVLGICLLEKTAFGRTYGLIDENIFYSDDNKAVYSCMKAMYDKSLPIDMLTVWEYITSNGIELLYCKGQPNGAAPYLRYLTDNVVSSAHLEYHCDLLKKMWRKRELEKLTNSGIDPMQDERKTAIELSRQISGLLSDETQKDWYDMDELVFNLLVYQQKISAGEDQLITTGFKSIDRINGGFAPGNMIIIGARPSVGKSALMGKIAIEIALTGKRVGIVSLEMNNNEIAARLASINTDIEFSVIYRNLFQDEQENHRFYNLVTTKTINLPISVSSKTKVDINEIKAKAAKLKYQNEAKDRRDGKEYRKGLDILMIDYLQLIDTVTTNKHYNREQEVSKISRGIKLLAMEMEIPIIVLCQLNREVTGRSAKDRYPKLQDLRESGSLEQDADVVIMLHRDFLAGYPTDEAGLPTDRQADLIGLKWRNFSPFHLKIDFDPQKMKFSEQARMNLIKITPQKDQEPEEDPF